MNGIKHLSLVGLLLASLLGSSQALAQDAGPGTWQFRLRGIVIAPDVSSNVSLIGGNATVNTVVVPEFDITYFVTEHISAELILATSKHNIGARGTAAGDLSLGHVYLLPPTLNVQYQFSPNAQIRPYIGAGINWTIFYGESNGDVIRIEYKNDIAPAIQAGVDYALNDGWFINADLKKIFLRTSARIDAGLPSQVIANVKINPWIFGIGVGRRF